MILELQTLWLAIILYVLAGSLAIGAVILGKRPERTILALMTAGLTFHALAIGLRWERLGHGPFITMFEILSSNLWSLLAAFTLAYWRFRPIRPTAALVMPILFVMMGWLLMVKPDGGYFPPTYRTLWLYIHVGLGKVFLGAVLISVGMSGVILSRRLGIGARHWAKLPNDAQLDDLSYRFMALALVFESLMLISGAIWAQDAWGRYWAWDPLETWAFITWLGVVIALHLRFTLKITPTTGAIMTILVFAIAFLTFFGVPFFSRAPHQGAI